MDSKQENIIISIFRDTLKAYFEIEPFILNFLLPYSLIRGYKKVTKSSKISAKFKNIGPSP